MIRRTPLRVRMPWLVAIVLLFTANIAWLVSFEVLYVRRAEARQKVVLENRTKIEALRKDLAARREGLERIRSAGSDKARFYDKVLGRPGDRFTDRVRRLRELAAAAHLRVSEMNFTETPLDVVPIRQVAIHFTTDGTYADLKRFLNSLELDDEFLSAGSISLSRNDPASGRPEIGFRIDVETAFHDPEALRTIGAPRRAK